MKLSKIVIWGILINIGFVIMLYAQSKYRLISWEAHLTNPLFLLGLTITIIGYGFIISFMIEEVPKVWGKSK